VKVEAAKKKSLPMVPTLMHHRLGNQRVSMKGGRPEKKKGLWKDANSLRVEKLDQLLRGGVSTGHKNPRKGVWGRREAKREGGTVIGFEGGAIAREKAEVEGRESGPLTRA